MTWVILLEPQQLTEQRPLTNFDSNERELNDCLKHRAAKNQVNDSSHTYVLCGGDAIIGSYCPAACAPGHAEPLVSKAGSHHTARQY